MFAGKHGFITLRDLFRWADRYRLEEQTETSQDWLQHLADDGEARRMFLFDYHLKPLHAKQSRRLLRQDTCCWQDA